MRELTHIERFVYNPAFAALGCLVILAGVIIIRRQSAQGGKGDGIPINLQTVRGCGLIAAGAFLAFVAILMTILGRTLLPG